MKILKILQGLFILFFSLWIAQPVFAQTAQVTATVRANPLQVNITAPSNVVVGQWFDITANISNLGDTVITKTAAVLNTPQELTVKGKKKNIGNLAHNTTQTVIWQAKANSSGSFIVQVEAEGFLDGEKIVASDTALIGAAATLGHLIRKLVFGV